MFSIMLATFAGASGPIRMWGPSGGGPLSAMRAFMRWKNAMPKARRFRSYCVRLGSSAGLTYLISNGPIELT